MPLPETGWIEFLGVVLLAVLLFTVATGIFYSLISLYWSRIDRVIHRPALAVQLGMLTVLAAHSAVVWLYALTYWSMAEWLELGNLAGMHESGELLGYVYFSVTTYSSLGFGDVFPLGPMRLLTGVEAIHGLIMIAWSATYTYIATEKYISHRKKAWGSEMALKERLKDD